MKEGILRSEAQQTTEYNNCGKVRRIDLTIRRAWAKMISFRNSFWPFFYFRERGIKRYRKKVLRILAIILPKLGWIFRKKVSAKLTPV